MAQTYNNCAETNLGGGVMSSFVAPLPANAQAHNPTVIGSVALRKGPQRFCPHCSDRCHALMLTCQNSALWQCCECCNNVLSSFWLPRLTWTWSIEQHGHHVTCVNWNEPHVSRLQLYEQPSAFNDAWIWAGGCKRSLTRYPKGQSRICYQECGCHLLHSW